MQLERQLGTTLFNRSSRSVLLTEAGRMFLEQCRLLVVPPNALRRPPGMASAGLAGTLRIGAVASAFSEALPEVLPPLPRLTSASGVTRQEIDSHPGRDALGRRELDVAVIRHAETGRQLHIGAPAPGPLRRRYAQRPSAGRGERPCGPVRFPGRFLGVAPAADFAGLSRRTCRRVPASGLQPGGTPLRQLD